MRCLRACTFEWYQVIHAQAMARSLLDPHKLAATPLPWFAAYYARQYASEQTSYEPFVQMTDLTAYFPTV